MTPLSFHSGGALPPQRHARSSTCPPQHRPQWAGHGHQGWCPVSSARNARGWGAAGRGWGVLRVGGAFVQYAQPLASGSRPSWSRAAQGGSLGVDVVPMACGSRASSARVQTGPGLTARPRRLRSCLRQVSTALTLMSPTSEPPTGIVGMPRFVFGARSRCTFDVSTMDTGNLQGLVPRTTRPITDSDLSERLISPDR